MKLFSFHWLVLAFLCSVQGPTRRLRDEQQSQGGIPAKKSSFFLFLIHIDLNKLKTPEYFLNLNNNIAN